MMRRVFLGAAGVAAVAGGSLTFYRWWQGRQPEMCGVCQRPVHAPTRTLAEVGGRRRVFCCPMCAVSEGERARVVALTDFETRREIDPGAASVVRGSSLNPCAEHGSHEAHFSADKRPLAALYDRCAPSILAFGERARAEEFARRYGGKVVAFGDLR